MALAGVPRVARPFRTAQYRILAAALALSLLGGGVWLVALVWQVIGIGGGPADLSLVATAPAIGLVLAVLFGGVAADRIPQKRILVAVEGAKTVVVGVTAVLSSAGALELWHLVIIAFLLGVADGFFYPAYSAILPSILPAEDLLAANGFEGVLRPALMQAAGPAAASFAIALASPAAAFAVITVSQVAAVATLVFLHPQQVRRDLASASTAGAAGGALRSVFADLVGGFRYMLRTPWLLSTLLFASILVLLIMGPIEVLLPFAVRDQTGGGAAEFALALGAFGVGGAAGSLLVASVPLPRRYLTVMILLWGAGCLPLAIIGMTSSLWLMVVALFVVGFAFSAATVIWGTLLQRRVPPELLGRVSSLDFFVSLAFMPISMALAGSVGQVLGLPLTYAIAGAVPVVLAVVAIVAARLYRDELRHPLRVVDEGTETSVADIDTH